MNTMNNLNTRQTELMATMLLSEHPDLYNAFLTKIVELVPLEQDLSLVPQIVQLYCEKKQIRRLDFHRSTDLRKEIIALAILFYHPEKMHYSKRRTKRGLIQSICEATGCNDYDLHNLVADAVFEYQTYKGFRSDIEAIFNDIKIKLK